MNTTLRLDRQRSKGSNVVYFCDYGGDMTTLPKALHSLEFKLLIPFFGLCSSVPSISVKTVHQTQRLKAKNVFK